jgi:hypothetical protein
MFKPEQFSHLSSSEGLNREMPANKPELALSPEEISNIKVEVENSIANLKGLELSAKGELRKTRDVLKKLVWVLGLLSASSCSPAKAPSPYDVARLKTPPSATERDNQFAKRRNTPNVQDQNQTFVTGNFFSEKK